MSRYAILIGNSQYPIESGLQDLRCPENDVEGMAEILGDVKYGNFNEPLKLKNRTTGEIKREIGKVFGRLSKEDLVLVYYSGHGKQDIEGQLYLATADTFAESSIDLMSTALSVSDLRNFIKQSKTNKVILILDCCYAGAIGKAILRGGDAQVALANMDDGRGTYILTSSTAVQTSQEKEEDQYGLLTKHILNGIKTGDAAKDNEDSISMDDLYKYVFEMVRREAPQTPMKWELNVSGKEFWIARVSKVEESAIKIESPSKSKVKIELEKLEPPGGVVRLGSQFYIPRKADELFEASIKRRDPIVLVKGARQIGKSSLLARGLEQARKNGIRNVVTDFQVLSYSDFKSLERFYIALGSLLADNLNADLFPEDMWNKKRGATINFGHYIKQLLKSLDAPLVWGLDEVDRLFSCNFGSEVFGLFRSWYGEREFNPDSPVKNLTMVFSYATEASLFIKDLNQSPFNVGTLLTLDDFSKEDVIKLNQLHCEPLENEEEIKRFSEYDLLGGHPFLVRCGLYEMVTKNLDFPQFEQIAAKEDGLFGDHLRRFIELLNKDSNKDEGKEKADIKEDVKNILKKKSCSVENFYRLRSAGLVSGESANEAKMRCKLYETYLSRHLL